MTDEEMNIAVAEKCGWVCVNPIFHNDRWHKIPTCIESKNLSGYEKGQCPPGTMLGQQPPDYGSDLNACAEMEKRVKDWNIYSRECELISRRDGKIDQEINASRLIDVFLIRLSATQRREAFLRTLNKYPEPTPVTD